MQLKNATLATQNEEKGRQLDTLYDEIAAQDNRLQEIYDRIHKVLENG
ncbi:hypothetical protein HSUHS1_0455 [Helicobacter suis HS1]|nr:hypothetical protein HSUHS1_0455 [Helicobacter suis HS1]